MKRRNGLHDDVVFQVVDDGRDLWLTSNRGLYRVQRERVLAAMNGSASDLSGTVYGMTDGKRGSEDNGQDRYNRQHRMAHLPPQIQHDTLTIASDAQRRQHRHALEPREDLAHDGSSCVRRR